MTVAEAADFFFNNLPPINTLVGFLAAVVSFLYYKADTAYAFECVGRGFAFSALPSGVAFVICSAYPSYVTKVSDLTAAFFIGGLVLILMPFVASKKISQVLGPPKSS